MASYTRTPPPFQHTTARVVAYQGFSQKVQTPWTSANINLPITYSNQVPNSSYNSSVQSIAIPVTFNGPSFAGILPYAPAPANGTNYAPILRRVEFITTTAFAGGSSPAFRVGTGVYVSASAPTPTITPAGTAGSTTYGYKVAGVDLAGKTTAVGTEGTTTTGNATLSAGNNNGIVWTAMANAVKYNIYRTTGGATQGLLGTATALSFTDTGLVADGSTPPSTNTTGADILGSTVTSAASINIPLEVNTPQNGPNGSFLQTVYVTVTGGPTSGAGYVVIDYINPYVQYSYGGSVLND